MDLLTEIGIKHNTDKATDHKFTEVYEKYFSTLKDNCLNIFEIGVWHGSSLRMLKEYFKNSQIYAIDFVDKKAYSENRITIEQGDQTDINFMSNVFIDKTFDIIIDDGGHTMNQQQISLEVMLSRLNPGGIYILEDLHTSTDPGYGGSIEYRNNNTTLHLIEQIANGVIEENNNFYIRNLQNIINQIQKCTVYRTNNNNSITSILIKNV
jgi:SAM-dependent methyltransferase